MEEKLLVGIDLCEDYTQLACCRQEDFTGEGVRTGAAGPESVGMQGKEEQYLIPSCLAVKRGSKEWVFGEEARKLILSEDALDAGGLLGIAEKNETVELYGTVFQPEDLLERYFRKVLMLLRQVYPDGRIACLVISLEERESAAGQQLQEKILLALERLGIEQERVRIQSHMASFLYYTISQEKELRQNDSAVFEFRRDGGLYYAQLSVNRRETPMIAAVTERNFSDYLQWERVQQEPEAAGRVFADVAEMAVHRKLLSAIYAVGRAFEGQWADEALMALCTGRKVFKGQNLYARGACYAAGYLIDGGQERVLFLGEERTQAELSMQMYVDGRVQDYILIPAAVRWQEASGEWDLILDREDELVIQVRDYVSKKQERHFIPLEGLPERERKMTRIRMKLHYTDLHNCLIRIRDMGFGEFAAASESGASAGRVWESILTI